jgi:hypothetical protein
MDANKQDLGKRIERFFMNEFLLLTVVIVYVAISYRPPSTEARGDQQSHYDERSSNKTPATHDD